MNERYQQPCTVEQNPIKTTFSTSSKTIDYDYTGVVTVSASSTVSQTSEVRLGHIDIMVAASDPVDLIIQFMVSDDVAIPTSADYRTVFSSKPILLANSTRRIKLKNPKNVQFTCNVRVKISVSGACTISGNICVVRRLIHSA